MVNDATAMESLVHKKLAGLRPDKGSEFFMAPYNSLFSIVELMVDIDDETNEAVNELIETVYRIKQQRFTPHDWI